MLELNAIEYVVVAFARIIRLRFGNKAITAPRPR